MQVKMFFQENLQECEFLYAGKGYSITNGQCLLVGMVEKLPDIKLAIYHWYPAIKVLQIPTRESALKHKFKAIVFEGDYSEGKMKKAQYLVKLMEAEG